MKVRLLAPVLLGLILATTVAAQFQFRRPLPPAPGGPAAGLPGGMGPGALGPAIPPTGLDSGPLGPPQGTLLNPGASPYPAVAATGGPVWGGQPGWGQPGWGQPGWGQPGWGVPGGQPLVPTPPPPGGVTVYRIYAFQSSEPIYTEDFNEVATLVRIGTHRFEGPAFFVSAQGGPGMAPLARMVRWSGTHFLSTDPQNDPRGRPEKVVGGIQLQPTPGWVPLYEWYHPERDLFLYTTDPRGEIAPAVGYRGGRAIGLVLPAR